MRKIPIETIEEYWQKISTQSENSSSPSLATLAPPLVLPKILFRAKQVGPLFKPPWTVMVISCPIPTVALGRGWISWFLVIFLSPLPR